MSAQVDVCQAIVDYMNAQPLSAPVQFIRETPGYSWALEDSNTLTCVVYPIGYTRAVLSRDQSERMIAVNVHVINYLNSNQQSEADDTFNIVEEIEGFLERGPKMAGFEFETFASGESARDPLNVQSMVDKNTFQVPITTQYKGY